MASILVCVCLGVFWNRSKWTFWKSRSFGICSDSGLLGILFRSFCSWYQNSQNSDFTRTNLKDNGNNNIKNDRQSVRQQTKHRVIWCQLPSYRRKRAFYGTGRSPMIFSLVSTLFFSINLSKQSTINCNLSGRTPSLLLLFSLRRVSCWGFFQEMCWPEVKIIVCVEKLFV